MNGLVLSYEKLRPNAGSWRPLLQHQAIVAVARAVLTHGTSVEPELSNDALFAPLNLDILPLLALVASDFSDFAEPEATTRPCTPIRLYRDSSFDAGDVDGLCHLLHPALVRGARPRPPRDHRQISPANTCIIAGDPAEIAERDGDLLASFNRIVHFRHLATRFEASGARLPDMASPRTMRRAPRSPPGWEGSTASRRPGACGIPCPARARHRSSNPSSRSGRQRRDTIR